MMIQKFLAGFACFFHAYAFVLESLVWDKKLGLKTFRMTAQEAQASKLMAFNQGFYNLFISIAIIVGFLLLSSEDPRGQVLIDYGMASALGAGAVLLFSAPHLKRPAILQALPGLLYFVVKAIGV